MTLVRPDVSTTPPVTNAWRDGDPVGHRKFLALPDPFPLQSGGVLLGGKLAYETWGTLAPDGGNAVLVEHALTGDSHVTGGESDPGWWNGLVGEGRTIDPDRWFVVCANALGGCQGSTGPSSLDPQGKPWGSRFPELSVRDMVRAEAHLADELGVRRWAAVIGGSLGCMRTLEWAVDQPDRVDSALLLAGTAAASAEQIAWCYTQLSAIYSDPAWRGGDYYDEEVGPHLGLSVARRIAHTTYRTPAELEVRFGQTRQPGEDRFALESYLDHSARKLLRRFDAGTYVALTRAMMSHNVGKDRGGVEAALSRITARIAVAGVDSDRLYPLEQQQFLADHIATAGPLQVIHSDHGHDGLLIEADQVGRIVADLLDPK
ncbi:homoserine O-acetyltransferase [Allokutzneria sp. A3M-2-11 16]|uniref:homoserine O-acetyltransferase MetX n=1 Tax=Allokutzneria sp. A3M-2-11 16 TaxID=2962043 RepID=UPI0020B6CD71|nr:homoserine O-acetyltransferase [Allokutzneria sp. A3M-2-11 16]MCP3802673.1 homoserine O-acetyltransferase [Allokutzneria sp. A3M-2-11 16]